MFPGRLSDQNEDYVRTKVLELKRECAKSHSALKLEAITADSPIPFSLKRLWFELDDFERITFQSNRTSPEALLVAGSADDLISNQYPPAGIGSSAPFLNNKAKGILGFLDGMRSRLLDQRYAFLFSPQDFTPDSSGNCTSDLPTLFANWFGHGRPVSVLDVSAVPPNVSQTIAGCILKIAYDALYWGQNTSVGGRQQPLLVVLDEAHTYLKAGENSISSRTVQAIAKEGRKYGVGMLLVTQRPSELDETVLSQCGSVVALRMTNARDRSHVATAIQDELREMADLLSSLRTGEAIITGEAVKIPSRVRFFQASRASKGSDPSSSELWSRERPDASGYVESVSNWRNQTFN